jgi:hypothetical protein
MGIKLHRIKNSRSMTQYQTDPVFKTGIGRYQVYKTDNANARAIGRRPRWTVHDLYNNLTCRAECDTLAEVREWIEKQITKGA